MALGADLTAQAPPVRIPKLKYRIPLPPAEFSDAHSTADSLSSDAPQPPATTSSGASSNCRLSFDSASVTSTSLASTTSSTPSSDGSKSSDKGKKKKASVFGFLSLKEPSQVALEQYAEAQRKQLLEKGTASPTSRSDKSYVTKKLPPTVPKVNSNWDGVPDVVKHRQLGSRERKKNRNSGTSQTSQTSRGSNETRLTALSWNGSNYSVMADGSRDPPNSIASAAQSSADVTTGANGRSISPSPSATTLPEMSYYFPEPLAEGSQPKQSIQPESYRPSMPEAPAPPPVSTLDFDLHLDQGPARSESPASSTDSSDTIVRDTADGIFKKLNETPHKNMWGDAAEESPNASHDVIIPESHDFLFNEQPPAETTKHDSPMSSPPVPMRSPMRPVQNFSRPMAPPFKPIAHSITRTSSYRGSRNNSALPTLYEASLASTESVDTIQQQAEDEDDDAYSIAPSTIAPSVLSSRWLDTPRERLGLGGRLRLNEGLPWDTGTETAGKPKKNRLSFFSKGTVSQT